LIEANALPLSQTANQVGALAVDGWNVTFGSFDTSRRGLGGAAARPCRPLLHVPNVTAHPLTAGVPITVLLHNGLLFCG